MVGGSHTIPLLFSMGIHKFFLSFKIKRAKRLRGLFEDIDYSLFEYSYLFLLSILRLYALWDKVNLKTKNEQNMLIILCTINILKYYFILVALVLGYEWMVIVLFICYYLFCRNYILYLYLLVGEIFHIRYNCICMHFITF